jgi:putative endopeptidase
VRLSSTTLTALAIASVLAAGCATKAAPPAPAAETRSAPAAPPTQAAPAPAPRPAAIHGIDPADMHTAVSACIDFNQYANGGWLEANPIPSDQSYWGSFSILFEENRDKLHAVLEKAAANASSQPGSDERKIGDFWASCMDEAAIEAAGATPIAPELSRIEKIATPADLQAAITRLQALGANAVFDFTAEQDRRASTEVIAIASQGGLGLPDRDYYTKTDAESKQLREKYAAHVARMFELLGDDPARAAANAKTVMAIETRLAESSMTSVELRDSEKTYNRMDLAKLTALTPNWSWTAYFQAAGVQPAAVNVAQPKFFEAVSREMLATPLSQWRTYLRWKTVNEAAPSLSKAFVDADFAFYGKTLQGTPENEVRWKRCVTATDAALGQALGKSYVRDYFPPEAKSSADAMVRNLVAALREDLQTLPWMGEATRQKALEKLAAFRPKIGYPDVWRDYSALSIDRGPYVLNVQRANEFELHRQLSKVGRPVDREDWQMTPPEVNAYYDPQLNEIVFPAGILQPPFFDPKADDAVNYGAMGAVIGHELTHGFDDEGRKFDARGNMSDWWTAEDARNYEARARCVENQFSAYTFEGEHVNGKLVLGESIADLGGLGIAYRAYRGTLAGKAEPPKIDGLSGDQRFYLGWARVWSANVRPEFSKLLMNTNPHPLPQFRAIGAPSNLPSFAAAFSCKGGDPMVRADICQIW